MLKVEMRASLPGWPEGEQVIKLREGKMRLREYLTISHRLPDIVKYFFVENIFLKYFKGLPNKQGTEKQTFGENDLLASCRISVEVREKKIKTQS